MMMKPCPFCGKEITEDNKCTWTRIDDPDTSLWESECGQVWEFESGTPKDNFMDFCCGCGKALNCKPEATKENDDERA
jgi:hypothetical protein